MTNDLDERARGGAAALHEAVRDLPLSTPRPTRASHRGRVLVLAAAAVVIVALAAALVGRGEDEQRLSTDPSGGAPRLVLDPPPTGMEATGAVDLPGGADETVHGAFWVYGDGDAADPFGDGDLAVVQLSGDVTLRAERDGATETEVDGHPAWVASDPDAASGLRSVFVDVDGSTIGLLSATLAGDELLAAAGELDLDAAPLEPPDELGALGQVGVARGAMSSATLSSFPVGAGHLVGYADDAAEATRMLVVASAEGGDGTLAVARWSLGDTARPVQVRGVEGWVGSPLGDPSPTLFWQESPGVVVTMTGFGIDEATLLSAAGSLRTATEDEWTALSQLSHTARVPDDALVGIANDDAVGSAYAVYRAVDGDLCVSHDEPDGTLSETCGGSGEAPHLVVSTERLASGAVLLYGYTTLGTDGELQIEATDGSLAGLSEAFDQEGTLFAGVFGDDTLPAEIVVLRADGTELGRAAVGAPGSESGGSGFSSEGATVTTEAG